MAKLRDVAERAGVSVSVASRVLSGDTRARVSPSTRDRVFAIAQELNYVADNRARALRSAQTRAIALVVPKVNNAVFGPLFAGVGAQARASGFSVLLGEVDDEDGEDALRRLIGNGRVDGVVLQRPEKTTDDQLRSLIDVSPPVVLFNTVLASRRGSVIIDDANGIDLAVAHLLGTGARRIGFIGGNPLHDAAQRREEGFRSALRRRGFAVDDDLIVSTGWEARSGDEGVRTLLALPDPPDSIVVASVNAGIGALHQAMSSGISVPDELAIIALQDTWAARYVTPALSTVEMPLEDAGRRAAEMLLSALEGQPLTDDMVSDPPPRLIQRESTRRVS
ncbi:LacI family DNA-binding transcriptional regulator [Microcella sp.]|uniref:LacI family DNA-binding transcriptional regulator n=1 Tax=Microcella sp. TaxID=1913979 RepID=UPI003F71E1C1